MRKQEVWTVISLTLRNKQVHAQLGMPAGEYTPNRIGQGITVPAEEAPKIGDQVQITYVWGADYSTATKPTKPPHVDELGFSGSGGGWK